MPVPRRLLVTALVVVAAAGAAGCGSSNGAAQPAGRSIQIQLNDQLRFSPDALSVRTGETVRFEVKNTGTVDHEFVVGDQQAQDQHEHDMQGPGGMGGMHMSETNGVEVPAGQTRTLTFTFSSTSGTILYGCHVNGHYGAGMRATITIT